MKRIVLFLGLALLAAVALGCAGGGDPISPQTTAGTDRASASGKTGLWGVWDVFLDPVSGTAEIAQLRSADFTCNVVRFLQPPVAPSNLISIAVDSSTDWATGYVVVDVTIGHPFPGLDRFTGFDVRGAVIANGSISGIADANILYGGEESVRLLNADGMTRWFNPMEFTSYGKMFGFTNGAFGLPGTDFSATLNPYKCYCEGLGAQDDMVGFFSDPACPNPRGMFRCADTLARRFELQFPMIGGSPKYRFQYAVIASWDLSDPDPPVDVPDDFPLSANCAEAYAFSAADQSDMFYTDPNNKGGTMRLLVRVFDHQGPQQPAGVLAEIAAIHLETPDGLITTGGLASFDPMALQSAMVSQDEKSATFLLEVPQVDPTGQGEVPVLVVIESAFPSTYDSGIPGFAFPDGNLASYLAASVSVGPGVQGDAPVAVAEIVTPPPHCPGDVIEFDGSGSYDPAGGTIVKYEWDFDGDGVYGDPYDSGTDVNPSKAFADSGSYTVDLRVTDDEALTDTLDDPLTLSIGGPTWVDDDADPLSADGSFDHPWPTIQQGIDNSNNDCGQRWVLVKDGVYEENVEISFSDIVVEGWSDPAPLLTTAEGSTEDMVRINAVQNATVRHFRAQPRCLYDPSNGIAPDGIHVGMGHDLRVDDIEFIDNPGGNTCEYAVGGQWGGDGVVVNDVRVNGYHKVANGFINVSGTGATVTNCVLLNITYGSPGGMYVLSVADAGATGLVAKNVVGHITYSEPFVETQWTSAVEISYCQGSTVRNNLVFDINNNLGDTGWTWGIDIYDAENMTLEHNTVSGIKGPAWIYAFEATDFNTDPSGVIYRDLIVTDLTAGMMGWRWAYLGMWASELPVDYSCAYNVGHAFYAGVHEVVEGTGFTYENPKFINPAMGDYRLQPDSPCKGTGHDGSDMGAYGGPDPLTWLPD